MIKFSIINITRIHKIVPKENKHKHIHDYCIYRREKKKKFVNKHVKDKIHTEEEEQENSANVCGFLFF